MGDIEIMQFRNGCLLSSEACCSSALSSFGGQVVGTLKITEHDNWKISLAGTTLHVTSVSP